MITPLDLRRGFPTVRRAFSDTDTRVFITALSFLCQENEVRQWRKRDERLYLANKQGHFLVLFRVVLTLVRVNDLLLNQSIVDVEDPVRVTL